MVTQPHLQIIKTSLRVPVFDRRVLSFILDNVVGAGEDAVPYSFFANKKLNYAMSEYIT